MNEAPCPVVACDIPSGIDGDTGVVLGEAVRAAWTVTFTCSKYGLEQGEGKAYAGTVEVADIGIPEEVIISQTDRCAFRCGTKSAQEHPLQSGK